MSKFISGKSSSAIPTLWFFWVRLVQKWQHRVCIKKNVGQYGALSDWPNNFVFFLFLYLFFLFKALQHKCWRSVGHQVLQPTKDVEFRTVCLKSCRQEKISKTALNLQPSDLLSNAYRSLSGDQFFFSCIYIHRNPREWFTNCPMP